MHVDRDTQTILGRFGEFLGQGNRRSLALLIPVVVFEVIFFIVPLVNLLRISLYESGSGAYQEGTVSISGYVAVLTSDLIRDIALYTFGFALVTTVITVIIATIYAYAIWRASGILRTFLLFAVVMPLLTTLVVRLYAWMVLLSPAGTVNDLLIAIGAIHEPLSMLNNSFSVVVGQIYIIFPYAVLAIFSVLTTMSWETVEAARDLGASRPRSVYEVVLPQMVPGVIVASVISLAWGVGAYASPTILGSPREETLAVRVETLMFQRNAWPEAAALALMLLVVVLVVIAVLFWLVGKWGGDIDYA